MVKRSKLLAVLIAGIITTTAFVGCGSKGQKEILHQIRKH